MRVIRVDQALKRVFSAARQPGGIRDLARNIALDLRFGGKLMGGAVRNPEAGKGFHDSENTDYGMLDRIFESVALGPRDVVVDVGCGKGRLLNWLLYKGFPGKIVGIEVNPEIAGFARTRLSRYRRVEIISGDATKTLPEDGTVFYLYNPFSGPLIEVFAEKLANLPDGGGRSPIRVVYFNPLHLEVFERQGIWDVRIGDVAPRSKHRVAYLERVRP